MRTNKQDERRTKSFVIANPMFDTVFKRLMENDRVVKFFIGTLLEAEVLSVDIRPQEYTHKSDDARKKSKKDKMDEKDDSDDDNSIAGLAYSIYRVDFVAIVKTKDKKDKKDKKILIEVQKGRDEDDVMRFRNYLGDQYKKEDIVDGESVVLPIITIYVLGFNLGKMNSPCIKVDRTYIDMLNKQTFDVQTPFLEKLTHDTYVIQTKRIALAHYRTKLEQLLGIFEQAHFIEENSEILKRYHQSDDDNKDVQFIASMLHEMGTDPEERKKIEDEAEALRTWEELYGRKLRKKDKVIEEKDKTIEEQDKVIEEKDKTIEKQDRALEEKDKALKEKDKALEELLKQVAELKNK
jgi:hypothetical protein